MEEALKLDELSLNKLCRYAAEMRALQQEVAVQQLLKDNLLMRIDPTGALYKLDAKIREKSAEYHIASQKYAKTREETGQKLGLEMSKYSYDDDTGLLYNLEETSEGTAPKD